MAILITGAGGQLGKELSQLLKEREIPFLNPGSDELDVTDKAAVDAYFEKNKPSFVFHCAAYTAVDAAEDEGKTANWEVNAAGTEIVAQATEKANAVLVYISTDYVFDGESSTEYQTDSPVNPQNEYGKAKLKGEQLVQEICSRYYIVRTSWVFGQYGKNFVYTMLRLAETNKQLTVVSDQIGRPTWTRTLAEFLLYLQETKPAFGIYHLANENSCSWYEFACEILKEENVEVKPVTSKEYPQKAVRPAYAIMDLSKAKEIGFAVPSWQEALKQFKQQIN